MSSRTASLPFPAEPPKAGPASSWSTRLAGEPVELLAARALWWPRERTLFVADVHLGKAATFRAGGVPVPRGSTASDLERLSVLVARTGAQRLAVLGDFLHAAAGRVQALDAAFAKWRESCRDLAITLVRGNHDARAGDPPAEWAIEVVAQPRAVGPFLLCHTPTEPPTGYALCGHVHPAVRLSGFGFESARVPCFLLGPRRAVLPAFGRFTGLATIVPREDERAVAIAGEALFALGRTRT